MKLVLLLLLRLMLLLLHHPDAVGNNRPPGVEFINSRKRPNGRHVDSPVHSAAAPDGNCSWRPSSNTLGRQRAEFFRSRRCHNDDAPDGP